MEEPYFYGGKSMTMPQQTTEKTRVTLLDTRMAVAVVLCFLGSTLFSKLGWTFTYGEMRLEIWQKMTSCIACMLCCQDSLEISKKAGINRIIITFIGGTVGILVILIDNWIRNDWIMAILVGAGILATLVICKAAKVPYINARIGGVTFILVTCTLHSSARIYYGIFRFISTIIGVLAVMLVTFLYQLADKNNKE